MKYQFEMTEGEFIAWQKLVKSVVKTIAATTLEHAKLRRSSPLESVKAVVKDAIREQVEAIEDDELGPEDEEVEASGDADDSEGATVTPLRVVPPSPASAIAKDEAAARATEERRVKVLHGKDTWVTLIEVWRQNFGVEGEQPDRVANLHAAASPFVAAYLQSGEGLTDATREAIYLLDGGDPEAAMPPRYGLTNRQLREARLIAENIAQVASFHAPWLTELLEYAFEYRTIPKED
jgi:hypothetical protein